MKKPLLLLAGVLSAGVLSAQITIDNTHVAPIGSVVPQAHDTLPTGITAGNSGASQTWNYSGLNEHTIDTLIFTNPDWTPNGADFPTSNLAAEFRDDQGEGGTMYLVLTSQQLGAVGQAFDIFGSGSDMSIQIDPMDVIIEFPATYLSTWAGSSTIDFTVDGSFAGADSVRIKSVTDKTSSVDAYGDLTTPLGTYPVIRVENQSTTTDSTWLLAVGVWTLIDDGVENETIYDWWTDDANVGFPLLSMSVNAQGDANSVDYLKSLPSPNGVDEIDNGASVSVYPNPTSSFVNFIVESDNARSIDIYNVTGQLVEAKQINQLATTFDMNGQNNGVYLYMLRGEDGEMLTTGKFSVIR